MAIISLNITPTPTPDGPVFLYSEPWFRFFQIIIPICSFIATISVVVFIVKRRMFKNLWHELVFINRLAACTFALSRLGMLVFIQLIRNNLIASINTIDDLTVHKTCAVFKAIELAGIYVTLGTNCVFFYCLFLMQKTYQEFLLTGNDASQIRGSVYLFLGWICFIQLTLGTITLLNGDEFIISDSYCLMIAETEKHMHIFRICGSIGFIFPYALGWLQAVRLCCTRRFKSIHTAFWPVRRMLFWLSTTFFLTNGWLVANIALQGYYKETKAETDRYIMAVLLSGLQNVIETAIIIHLVLKDIKRRRSFGTAFTEPFQTPALISGRLVIGPTKSSTTAQTSQSAQIFRPSTEQAGAKWTPAISPNSDLLPTSPELP